MSWFSSQWDRLNKAFEERMEGSSSDVDDQRGVKDLEIVWGRERLQVSLPPSSPPPTLATLRAEIANLTSIPANEQKLVFHGLILRDDSAPLKTYNIRSGSRIMLIGTSGGAGAMGDRPGEKQSRYAGESGPRTLTKGEMLAEERKRKEEDRSEEGVTRRIDEVLQGVTNEIEPQLKQFEARVATATGTSSNSQGPSATTPTPTTTASAAAPAPSEPDLQSGPTLKQRQRLLNELLSRALLSLDAIPAVSEDTRVKRREAVRSVQSLLDRLDRGWEQAGKQ